MSGWDEPDPYADVTGAAESVPIDEDSQRLLDVVGRVESTIADITEAEEAAEREGGEEVLPPEIEQRMAQLCAEDGAPLEWRSISDRVQRGTQTWKAVYARPRELEGPAGVALVREALTGSTRDVLSQLRAGEESLLEQVDALNRQRIRRD